jgi:hypothetical protein
MEWARILAYITGSVDQELLLRSPGKVACRSSYLTFEDRPVRQNLAYQFFGRTGGPRVPDFRHSDPRFVRSRGGALTDDQTVTEAKESFGKWIDPMLQSVHRMGYRAPDIRRVSCKRYIEPWSGTGAVHT